MSKKAYFFAILFALAALLQSPGYGAVLCVGADHARVEFSHETGCHSCDYCRPASDGPARGADLSSECDDTECSDIPIPDPIRYISPAGVDLVSRPVTCSVAAAATFTAVGNVCLKPLDSGTFEKPPLLLIRTIELII